MISYKKKRFFLILVIIVSNFTFLGCEKRRDVHLKVPIAGKVIPPHPFYAMNPVLKLNSRVVSIRGEKYSIKKLPDEINSKGLLYTFINFDSESELKVIENVIPIIISKKMGQEFLYIDSNSNLDFTDDGERVELKDSVLIPFKNFRTRQDILIKIKKAEIKPNNYSRLLEKYESQFPNSDLVAPNNWYISQVNNFKVGFGKLKGNDITVLLYDKLSDGEYRFSPDKNGDKALVLEGKKSINDDFYNLMSSFEPLNSRSVFTIFGENYSLANVTKDGSFVTFLETDIEAKSLYKVGDNISNLKMSLINGIEYTVEDLLTSNKPLLLDIGGTWCSACVFFEPMIKDMYDEGAVDVVGLFLYDTEGSVRSYINRKNISWSVGLVDEDFQEKFNIQFTPTYLLIDSNGDILSISKSPDELRLAL